MSPAAAAAGLGEVEGQELIESCLVHSLHKQRDLPPEERSFVGIEILLRVFGAQLLTDPTFAAPHLHPLVIESTGRTPS